MGITIEELVYQVGGGHPEGKEIKAVQTGGPSGGCIPTHRFDLPVDYEKLAEAGSIMGSGGMVVMDEDTCMVDVAKYFLEFLQDESCGQCAPCRLGLPKLLKLLNRITRGEGDLADLEAVQDLAETIKTDSLCGLGQTAPNPVLSTIKYFREEYEDHILEERCPACVCQELMHYRIEEETCRTCGLCAETCSAGVIEEESDPGSYRIEQSDCLRCGACLEECPFDAISRVPGKPIDQGDSQSSYVGGKTSNRPSI